MKAANEGFNIHLGRHWIAGPLLLTICACGALRPTTTSPPAVFTLDGQHRAAPAAAQATSPTLIVSPAGAASGFDGPRMIYVRTPHRLEAFAHSVWVDPPARMLTPLIVDAISDTGAFRAAVPTPSAAAGDFRLDTTIIRLQHEFTTQPSRVRFTLRAYLVAESTRQVIAWREFDVAVSAASEDPHGGVAAANLAVQAVLESLSTFCAAAVRERRDEP